MTLLFRAAWFVWPMTICVTSFAVPAERFFDDFNRPDTAFHTQASVSVGNGYGLTCSEGDKAPLVGLQAGKIIFRADAGSGSIEPANLILSKNDILLTNKTFTIQGRITTISTANAVQGYGLAWNVQDAKNYYAARINTGSTNVIQFLRVKNGAKTGIIFATASNSETLKVNEDYILTITLRAAGVFDYELSGPGLDGGKQIGRITDTVYKFTGGTAGFYNLSTRAKPCFDDLRMELTGGAVLPPVALPQDTQIHLPTHANVIYGPHERNVLDFWRARSDAPTPVVLVIHGGGWGSGDKSRVTYLTDMDKLLKAGISIVSINYRFLQQAQKEGVQPPVRAPLMDAARALQFVRSKATEWNIDKERIGATGGSAGACSALWLALHDDLANPASSDPVTRESTRLWCAALGGAQTSLDPHTMREWIPNIAYGGGAFGFQTNGVNATQAFQNFYDSRADVLPFIKEFSPIEHASAGDPPLWLSYGDKTPAAKGQVAQDPTHSALFGCILEARLKSLGVEYILTYPGKPSGDFATATDYLIYKLKK